MVEFIALALVSGALAAVLVHIGIWAPRKTWVKVVALVTAACFLPTAYAGLAQLLGRPKPIVLEWTERDLTEAAVLSAQMREGEAIYLWLGLADVAEPRSYVLPWDENTARQLHKAQRKADETGTDVRMRMPFEPSLERDGPMFYADPQPNPPPKSVSPNSPVWFQRSKIEARRGPG